MATITKTYDLGANTLPGGSPEITVTASAEIGYNLSESNHSEAVVYSTGQFDFALKGDGTYGIAGIGSVLSSSIEIPSEHGGVAVTQINPEAFLGNKTIVKIKIPKSITYIGSRAFRGCEKLATIEFEDDERKVIFFENPGWGTPYVQYIWNNGASGFQSNECMMDLVEGTIYSCALPKNATSLSIRSEDGNFKTMAFAAPSELEFTNCLFKATASESYVEGVNYVLNAHEYYNPGRDFKKYGGLTISQYAFSECPALTSVQLPKRLVGLGDYAFQKCTALQTVTFSDSHRLLQIGLRAFYYCTQLESVYMKNGVRIIGTSAFTECDLRTCELGMGLEDIRAEAFAGGNMYLTEIIIPTTVKRICENAFKRGGALERKVMFENRYTWVMTSSSDTPNSSEGVTLWNPADLYCEKVSSSAAKTNGDRLAYDFADKYWHRLDQMLPPQISISGDGILSMTDPLGVAEKFRIYVNGSYKCEVVVN